MHISTKLSLTPETVEVICKLIPKEKSTYSHTITLNGTTRERVIQGTVDNLVPYTNYTATCWVLRDGVDQCYIGSNTTQTYTDSEFDSVSVSIV